MTQAPRPTDGHEDASWLRAWRNIAGRRLQLVHAVRAATAAIAALTLPAALLVWGGVPWPVVTGVVLASTVAIAIVRARALVQGRAVERTLESRVPASRNLLLTALELGDAPDAASTPMTPLVLARARALARSQDLPALLPLRWRPALAALGVLLAAQVAAHRLARSAPAIDRTPAENGASPAVAFALEVRQATVSPPRYLARRDSIVATPARLHVPERSMLRLELAAAGADSVQLDAGGVRRTAEPHASVRDAFVVDWRADSDDVLALTAYRGPNTAHALVGVTVVRDADPQVRIEAPGRDLVLPRADTALRILVTAEDDHALSTLQLRYTRVSGSGERYEFEEGEVPLALRRSSPTRWEGSVTWDLAALALGAGDVLVYKAVTADRRPGAPLVESDAWIAEVPTGRGDGAEGFAVDVGETRYALSQQMVVLRIERLLAARDSLGSALDDATFAARARNIAAEQRRVRAEFVFLMGGELAEEISAENSMGDLNEHQHTEVEADLSAGRVRNEGRDAVFSAIRAMSRAATALTDTAVVPALQQARLAVEQLEVAFSRARFLMRPLATREAIDRARRLTGALAGVTSTTRPAVFPTTTAAAEARTLALRALARPRPVAPVVAATADTASASRAADWQRVAGTLLRSAPADPRVQVIALALNDAAVALRNAQPVRADSSHDQALLALQAWALEDAATATGAVRAPRSATLQHRVSSGRPRVDAPTRP